MSLLLDLPKEIIEKIFIFSGNLKNLMQTSSVLSGLISTSSHLMQTFELHLCSKDHPLDLDIFLNSKRDYRRLWMKSGDTIPCEVWDILEKFGDTLNILKISNTFLKTNEFQRIIRTAEQLKVLELISVCYAQNMTISQLNQLELPNLRILRLFDSNFQ